ncbi:MAG: hypothetical protein WDN23_11150 [Edaphobacter sp.]
MKNQRLNSILHSGLIAGALTIGSIASLQSAAAQGVSTVAEATIPFAFQTANQTLPAGTYRIDRETDHLILLRGNDGKSGMVLMINAVASHTPTRGMLVFDHYGDKYFLRQIWTKGDSSGLECPKSRAEKQTLEAKNKQTPDTTEVAFNTAPSR